MEGFQDYPNVYGMLRETVERCSGDSAYRWFTASGVTASTDWTSFLGEVRQAAKSLMALGIQKDDKVSILSYSSYRWVLSDIAVNTVGAATVGIYHSLPARDCLYILSHSDSVAVFVQNAEQLEKVLAVRKDLPALQTIVLMEGSAPGGGDGSVVSFEAFKAMGASVSEEELDARIASVGPQDVAAIVYTSGTTGIPKGAMLTHDNLTFTAQSVEKSVYWKPGDEVFLFLPLAHVFARTCVYTSLLSGTALTFCRAMDSIAEDLKAARPHWFPSVPRIYEKVYAKIIGGVEAKGGVSLKIFRWAMSVGRQVSRYRQAGREEPLLLKVFYAAATRLVFSKIQAALGGRVRWCISGAAPLDPEIGRFFHAAGVLVVEGIGMTENTSFSNLNRYDNYRFGWVGPPGPGIEQKIADDGEILFRGRNVMKGYYKMPDETKRTLSADGWLHSGDLGEIDDENFLRVTGRKKDIIVTSGGKNIAPSAIELTLAQSPYINQVFVIGDKRNYLTALVTLDPDNIAAYANARGISFSHTEELVGNREIVTLIEQEVADRNQELASFETVKKVTIVPEFTIEQGLLTPTMKLKKMMALERYREQIDAMYAG
ncbi:MAG: long-chain fatty acid--CoA ligase [Desulfobacteraceae bacterium]|nr:long-chain fatty acid--CoA ligase [Desulfobacteraceae bacterium]